MNETIKVRFAPSPTGYLHIGGVRTALFNWLFARHHGGKFVLRIEDTDQSRSTEESIEEILAAMTWLGLDWDEGPYRQMERQSIYNEKVEQLLKENKAYPCYCTPEELEARKKEASEKGLKPKYDGRCRNRNDQPEGLPSVIRFKTDGVGLVTVHDMLRGNVVFDKKELDDLIIRRSDGTPTYNFVVVVDDAEMGITHVIRGDDHLSNTPRQALLYDALDYPRPKFVHISMILGQDKSRLSKRHGATSTLAYRDMGYLPDAVINYLARLGWSAGDQEIFSREELIKLFTFDNVGTSAAVFNPEKLLWLNQHYIKTTEPLELAKHLLPILEKENILPENHGLALEEIAKPIPHLNERSETLVEMAQKSAFYFKEMPLKKYVDGKISMGQIPDIKMGYSPYPLMMEEKARDKFLKPEAKTLLEQVVAGIEAMAEPTAEALEELFKDIVAKAEMKLGKLAQPVRVALTGTTTSPGIYDTILLLGKERSLLRLKSAVDWISSLTV
jgi:glutamyl-tRNA synthetase